MPAKDRATRDRILEQAAALFADRGFKKVTVREICQAAGANVAAVNYHFGDKAGLYRRVFESAIEIMKETNELAMAAGRGRAPEEQLRAYVVVFVARVTESGRHSWIHRLMSHELDDPSDAFEIVMRDVLQPRIQYLAGVIAAISGWPPEDVRVFRVITGLQVQLLMFLKPMPRRLPAQWKSAAKDATGLAEHIADFTVAGIKGMAAMPAVE